MVSKKAKETRDARIIKIISQLQARPCRAIELADQLGITKGQVYHDILEIQRDFNVTKTRQGNTISYEIKDKSKSLKGLQCLDRKNVKSSTESITRKRIEKDLKKDFINRGITRIYRHELIDWYCDKYLGRGNVTTRYLRRICESIGLDVVYGMAM